jgi:hypothetical protein
MKIEKKTHYLSIRTKRHLLIIGNAYGSGFTITDLYRCKKYQ